MMENNELEAKLSKSNNDLMTDIICYIRSFPISIYLQEQVRKDITLMLLNGEENNQNAKEVLGEDYQVFCDECIAELPKLSYKERWIIHLGEFCLYSSVMSIITLFFSCVNAWIKKELTLPTVTVSAPVFIQGLFIIIYACLIVHFITKTSLRKNDESTRIYCSMSRFYYHFISILYE